MKLEAWKAIKELEPTRNKKRRELFGAQDRIDEQRDGLIGKTEKQLKKHKHIQPMFVIRWKVA